MRSQGKWRSFPIPGSGADTWAARQPPLHGAGHGEARPKPTAGPVHSNPIFNIYQHTGRALSSFRSSCEADQAVNTPGSVHGVAMPPAAGGPLYACCLA